METKKRDLSDLSESLVLLKHSKKHKQDSTNINHILSDDILRVIFSFTEIVKFSNSYEYNNHVANGAITSQRMFIMKNSLPIIKEKLLNIHGKYKQSYHSNILRNQPSSLTIWPIKRPSAKKTKDNNQTG